MVLLKEEAYKKLQKVFIKLKELKDFIEVLA
jgi:hypothetical protein